MSTKNIPLTSHDSNSVRNRLLSWAARYVGGDDQSTGSEGPSSRNSKGVMSQSLGCLSY
jgi:hypothetical protein